MRAIIDTCIVTRNTKDYRLSAVAVYSPDEFLRVLEAGEQTKS